MRVADLLLPDVREMLATSPTSLGELAEELEPADLADVIGALGDEEAVAALGALPLPSAAAVFDNLPIDRRVQLCKALGFDRAAPIVEAMSPDERADLFGALDEEARAQLFGRLGRETAREVRALLAYPERSAGGLMTTGFVALPAEWPVEKAIQEVRRVAEQKETVYDAFAVDEHGILLGKVSLRDLVLAKPSARVADVMDTSALSVEPTVDGEEVARLITRYDLLSLPVVDRTRRLVGIVTVDDVVDLIQQEATEEIQKMGGMEALDEPYLQIRFHRMLKKRGGWLALLFLGEMLTATAMSYFEDELARALVLAVFVPLIISSGGNSGSQATTLVIRAMALGEVKLGDWWRVVRRELGAGLALGAILGTLGVIRIGVWQLLSGVYGEHALPVALTVGVSLLGVVTFGTLAGSLLPFGLRWLGFEPASASAPLVATLVDVTGLVIYFSVAAVLLSGSLL